MMAKFDSDFFGFSTIFSILLLGSGEDFNLRFTYALQEDARGIADALNKARVPFATNITCFA